MKNSTKAAKQNVTTTVTAVKPYNIECSQHHYDDPFLGIKIENVTAGLNSGLLKVLHKLALSSEGNALVIANYILAMKTEINLSDNYRRENIKLLYNFSKYHNDKPFRDITRENISVFLDSFRRPAPSYRTLAIPAYPILQFSSIQKHGASTTTAGLVCHTHEVKAFLSGFCYLFTITNYDEFFSLH